MGGGEALQEKNLALFYVPAGTKSAAFHSDDADASDNLCLELFKMVSGFLCLSRRGLLGLHKQAGVSPIAFFSYFLFKKST